MFSRNLGFQSQGSFSTWSALLQPEPPVGTISSAHRGNQVEECQNQLSQCVCGGVGRVQTAAAQPQPVVAVWGQ